METAGTCSTCVGKSNKIGVSNRRANGPLMQLNVNFNGPRRLEQCPWIVATDAQCDGQVPGSRKNFGPDLRPFPRDLWCSTSPKRRARWMPRDRRANQCGNTVVPIGSANARCTPACVPIAGGHEDPLSEDGHPSGGLGDRCSNRTRAGIA
jgi:hypothetical protein